MEAILTDNDEKQLSKEERLELAKALRRELWDMRLEKAKHNHHNRSKEQFDFE